MPDITCEYEGRCLNAGKNCFRCFNLSQLKLPEDKQREKAARKAESMAGTSGLKPWEQLEEKVARDLSNLPTVRELEARRNPGSGNKWYRPADVLDEILMPECKTRAQFNGRGEQQITLTKEMLEKVIHEAEGTGRAPCLVFQFAGDDRPYVAFDWNILASLVQEHKAMAREYARIKGLGQ